jgi:hypothetical protein
MTINTMTRRIFTIAVCASVGAIAAVALALSQPHVATAQTAPLSDDLEAKGIITALPSGTLFGAWVIGGNSYQASSGVTEFRQENGPLTLNGCAEVKYVLQGSDRIALRIKSDDDCSGNNANEIETYGLVVSRPPSTTLFGSWQIGSQTYQAISGTTTFRQDHGALVVGICAEVKWITATTQLNALRITSKSLHDCSGAGDDNEALGVIQALPTSGLIGIWQIGGLSYTVTPSTTLEDGPFVVGALVEVHFNRASTGSLIATRIERKSGVEDDDERAKLYGRIEARPAPPAVAGTWVIASTTFSVTNSTLLSGTLLTGQCVEVHYHLDGPARVADKIKNEGEDDCVGVNGEVSRAFGFVDAMPSSGFVGAWRIGGETYDAPAGAEFKQQNGALIVGAFVKVAFVAQGGAKVVVEIETEDAPDSGDDNRFGALRLTGGQWSVDGQPITLDDATMFDDRLAEVRDGGLVRVNLRSSSSMTAASADAGPAATKIVGLTRIERAYLALIRK